MACGFESRPGHNQNNRQPRCCRVFWLYIQGRTRTGKGSGKHLFSRGGRNGKTAGFPGVRVPALGTLRKVFRAYVKLKEYGARSSAVELPVVVRAVAGSNPVEHPRK